MSLTRRPLQAFATIKIATGLLLRGSGPAAAQVDRSYAAITENDADAGVISKIDTRPAACQWASVPGFVYNAA